MTKRLINIDDQTLRAAQARLGTSTMTDTVNEALRRVGGADSADFDAAVAALTSVELVDRTEAW